MLALVPWVQSEYDERVKQLKSDIAFHNGKQEAELTLRVNNTAFYGDLHQLKSLILKTPTTTAASLWYEQNGSCQFNLSSAGSKLRSAQDCDVSISSFFPRINYSYQFDHVDIFFSPCQFGNTQLLEAVKQGHERVAALAAGYQGRLGLHAARCLSRLAPACSPRTGNIKA
jgi:hyperpolarization activated cyclic nucleotide-gated potassium channel 4